MEIKFTKSDVKEFVVEMLKKMTPPCREVHGVSSSSSNLEFINHGENKAVNLERLVYLRAIEEIDSRLNEYIATKTV